MPLTSFRARLAITGAILLLVAISRLSGGLVARAQGGPPLGTQVPALLNLPSMMMLLPMGMALVEWRERRGGGRNQQLASLLAYGSAAAIASFLYVNALQPLEWSEIEQQSLYFAPLTFSVSTVFLAVAVNVMRSLHWYRCAVAQDRRRVEAERAGVERTRNLIERRFRPRVMIAMLERIAQRVSTDAHDAEGLLLRLARHERLLLDAPDDVVPFEQEVRFLRSCLALEGIDAKIEIEGSGGKASAEATRAALAAIEEICRAAPGVRLTVDCRQVDGHLRVRLHGRGLEERVLHLPIEATRPHAPEQDLPAMMAPSPSTTFAPLAIYLLVSVVIDSIAASAAWRPWEMPVATFASLLVWLGVAPLVNAAAGRAVRFRFPAAVALAFLAATAGAACATAGGLTILRAIEPAAMRPPVFLPYLASRNMLVGLTLAAMSFALAWGRILLQARADAARASQSLLEAEARELEARFHPHFLLNALSAVAALIRRRPADAAATCRRLGDLISRTVASAGEQWWSLDEELQLVSGYVEIQRLRFGDRLRAMVWDVDPGCASAIIPRFVLQPLVENAFKHGVAASRRAMDVRVSIRRRGRELQIEVANGGEQLALPPTLGNGLRFVESRCRAAGGELALEMREGELVARCSLPLRRSRRN